MRPIHAVVASKKMRIERIGSHKTHHAKALLNATASARVTGPVMGFWEVALGGGACKW